MLKKYLEIGKIVSTHGIKGEVKVDSWCDSPLVICKLKKIYLQNLKEVQIVSSKANKNQAILKLKGIDSVETAQVLRGCVISADRDDIKLKEGRYFIQDIIGLNVTDNDTSHIYGKVTDVFATGANNVYEITDSNGKKYLMPAIDDVIVSTNIDAGEIKIIPMKGIFDDED